MDEPDVLHHLLKIEADAAALVADAQTEADKLLAEGEKQNRANYEERYTRESAAQNAEYEQKIGDLKEDHQKQLDSYRRSLEGLAIQTDCFSELLGTLLKEG
jgi:vacuolar-type H+-ATPase subunit H